MLQGSIQYEERLKKIEMNFTNTQRDIHEKNAQLKMAQEQMNQLKQEMKFLEDEYIKSRAIIMKFEEEIKVKYSPEFISKKLRKTAKIGG